MAGNNRPRVKKTEKYQGVSGHLQIQIRNEILNRRISGTFTDTNTKLEP